MAETKRQKITPLDELLRRVTELENENERLKSLLLTDELTGLYNKRFFYLQLEVETTRARRTGQPCTLIALDLDNFKNVNDTFGHYIGDQLLSQFAGILGKSVRPTDFACRFGGDEFFIIMPSSGLTEGIGVAKRIQNSLKSFDFTVYTAEGRRVSVSVGLAIYKSSHKMSVDAFFQQADGNLCQAKKTGKNHIFHDLDAKAENTAVNNAERKALSVRFAEINEMEKQ
ncbi:MAG: diguanylate cyclase [Syntrophales bacterium]|jgi:diguanylate cyclase (GGDEF)-like protein|nr:diguanylate cyclase [Syntrophales bacterium]